METITIPVALDTTEFDKQVKEIKATITALPKFPMPIAVHNIAGQECLFFAVAKDTDSDRMIQVKEYLEKELPTPCTVIVFALP